VHGYTPCLRATPEQTPIADRPAEAPVESARYVLYGRILPALRHALVGELQALRFAIKLAETGSGVEMLARLGEQVTRSTARAEALTSWFQPDSKASGPVAAAVDDCIALVRTEWQIRGVEAIVQLTCAAAVRSHSFRELLAAFLVALGDELSGPADVMLRVRQRGSTLVLKVSYAPAAREGDTPRCAWPRRLRWPDVEALAQAHAIRWTRRANWVAARFPAADAAFPPAMAQSRPD
jgi:hypothetical protein